VTLGKSLGILLSFFEIKNEEVLERVLKFDLLSSLLRLAFLLVEDLHVVSSIDLNTEIIEGVSLVEWLNNTFTVILEDSSVLD